jgi:archaemetzincin
VVIYFAVTDKKIPFLQEDRPTKIGIQPLGDIADREVDSVKSALEKMYGFEVLVLKNKDLYQPAYTTRRTPRYRADTLLNWLSRECPSHVDMVVGLTNKDISWTKFKEGTMEIKEPQSQYIDFGIFGLGSVGGKACILSSNRLRQNVTTEKFYKRLSRIACHEVGHVLGLKHCPTKQCLMNDANESIKTIDNSTGDLCAKCKSDI